MPYAVHQGVKIYWEEHGSGDPIVMVMGLGFTLDMWYRILPVLAKHHRVILFDNRGVGRSDVPRRGYSIRHMAQDAFAVMEAANVDNAYLMGASMGGMIAQEMALQQPDRFRALLLGCTSPGGLRTKIPRISKFHRKAWRRMSIKERAQAFVPLLYAQATPRERVEQDLAVRIQGAAPAIQTILRQAAGIVRWSSYRRLPSLRLPVLIMHGDSDLILPAQNGRLLAKRIPNAEFVLVPQAGHVFLTDQPEFTIQALMSFLDRQSARQINQGITGLHSAFS